jgi:hypothetical protein
MKRRFKAASPRLAINDEHNTTQSSKSPGPKKNIRIVIALLENQVFCDEAQHLLTEIAAFAASSPPDDQRDAFVNQRTTLFVKKWGVPPPHAATLIDPDPARPFADAIMSGQWGTVPIFGWTTDVEIRAAIKRIRRVVRKRHQDAQIARLAQQARWLEDCSYSRPEIASAVWGRRKGLRRRSKEQAIAVLKEDVEREWYKKYLAQGREPEVAERLIYKRARGSEAPASATVRMAEHRYEEDLARLNAALASPATSEPISAALTMLYRADNPAEVRRGLVAFRKALVPPPAS